MGKAFPMDQKLMIVTKLVGVETGLVKGAIRTVKMDDPLSDTLAALSEDVAALIKKDAASLLPEGPAPEDGVSRILKALSDRKRPTVAVIIPEHHVERPSRDRSWTRRRNGDQEDAPGVQVHGGGYRPK